MKKIFIVLIFSSCLTANAQEIKTLEQELAGEIGEVDLKFGITSKQADSTAQYYCRRYVAGCGSALSVIDRNSNWEATPVTGVEGVSDKSNIVIGKHTGRISWKRGPALSLTDLIGHTEMAPEPINKDNAKPQHSSGSTVRIQFLVLPTGTVADARFRHSSKNLKCDLAARRIVEGWRFSPRNLPITLVTNVKACSQ